MSGINKSITILFYSNVEVLNIKTVEAEVIYPAGENNVW